MGKLTKNQKLAAEKIEAGKAYSLKEAASLRLTLKLIRAVSFTLLSVRYHSVLIRFATTRKSSSLL